jgi:hypothetical protein
VHASEHVTKTIDSKPSKIGLLWDMIMTMCFTPFASVNHSGKDDLLYFFLAGIFILVQIENSKYQGKSDGKGDNKSRLQSVLSQEGKK